MRDIDIIDLELALADVETAEKRVKKAQGAAKTGNKEGKSELAFVERVFAHLQAGKAVRSLQLTEDETKIVATMGLMTIKPVLYCCNVGETDLPAGNAWSNTVRERAAAEGAGVVILCGKVEAELAELPEADRGELLASYGLVEPALATLARECYRLLGLQSYFTAGPKEIRAWTIRKGASAPEAAGVIHTDFERGFIRAQVYAVEDLEQYGSEAASRPPARCASRGRNTSSTTATSCCSFTASSGDEPGHDPRLAAIADPRVERVAARIVTRERGEHRPHGGKAHVAQLDPLERHAAEPAAPRPLVAHARIAEPARRQHPGEHVVGVVAVGDRPAADDRRDGAAGHEHAADLGDRGVELGDDVEPEVRDDGVEAAVRERHRLGEAPHVTSVVDVEADPERAVAAADVEHPPASARAQACVGPIVGERRQPE